MHNTKGLGVFLILAGVLIAGCAAPVPPGKLGYSDSRRVVIAGENVPHTLVEYYEKQYAAPVWYTSYRGRVANAMGNLFESGLAPSWGMRSLINELKSLNDTVGKWEIIVPKIGEKYFFNALKHMGTSSLARARGIIVLIDSSGFPALEREVQRVTDSNFFVSYEFHKD